MRRRRRVWLSGGALVLAVALVAAGCGSSSKTAKPPPTTAATAGSSSAPASSAGGNETGITPTTITLGQVADVSGPVPGLFSGAVNGLDAWAAYVNSTGGIDGRKIVIDHKDSALDCVSFTNDFGAMPNSAFASVGNFSVVDTCGEATLKAKPGFPVIPSALSKSELFPYPNVYTPNPQPPGWITTGYQWIKNKYGASAVQKAAAIYSTFEAPAYAQQSAAAKSVGYNVVYARGVGPTETNFTSDILRMKSDGVQVVDLTDNAVNTAADFLQQAAQQSFHPRAVISFAAYDPTFFKLVGNPADANDLIMPLTFALYLGQDSGSVPEVKTMTDWLQKTHPGAPMNLYVLEAWSAGLLFQAAMVKAGPNPGRSQLLAGLKAVTSFTANGLLPPDNPGQRIPPVCVAMTGVVNGKFARIDPPKSGFQCKNAGYFYYHGP